jgi:F-type H+/Na+-transporting ATPase subunit alpha
MANLKLEYAQFEELETFARFGTRLDKNTRQIIEHGKRIRICLKQQELEPMSVISQVIVLLALTSGFFDTIPIEKMEEAQVSLLQSIKKIDDGIAKRLLTEDKVNPEDKKAILAIAEKILIPFQVESEEDQNKK